MALFFAIPVLQHIMAERFQNGNCQGRDVQIGDLIDLQVGGVTAGMFP